MENAPKLDGIMHGPFPEPEFRDPKDPRPMTVAEIVWRQAFADPELYQWMMVNHYATLDFVTGRITEAAYRRDMPALQHQINMRRNVHFINRLPTGGRRRPRRVEPR